MLYRYNATIRTDWNLVFWDNSLYVGLIVVVTVNVLSVMMCSSSVSCWCFWRLWWNFCMTAMLLLNYSIKFMLMLMMLLLILMLICMLGWLCYCFLFDRCCYSYWVSWDENLEESFHSMISCQLACLLQK